MMKRLSYLGQNGVTLIEMLLVMGLLAIFLTVITTIFTATIDSQNQSQGYSAVVSDARFIMARLNYDIDRASVIVTPASLSTACSTSLQLTIGTTYAYTLNGSDFQLNQNDGNGPSTLNSDNIRVSGLCFQRLGNTVTGKDAIRYSFTLTSTAVRSNSHDTQTFTSTAVQR